MRKKVLIRADATNEIGSGHIMRCIGLADLLHKNDYEVHLLTYLSSKKLIQRIKERRVTIHLLQLDQFENRSDDLEELLKLSQQIHPSWVITDGYHFETAYQKCIKEAGYKLMCIDDTAGCHYYADIVLNQNVHASKELYSAEDDTEFFLGAHYALIRSEFTDAARGYTRKINNTVANVLITMGGADPGNVSLKVLEDLGNFAMKKDNKLHVRVIAGALNSNIALLKKFSCGSKLQVEILTEVGEKMPALMKWADVAVTAGGISLWEYAYLATPVLGVIVAKNQQPLVETLGQRNAVVNIGWHHDWSSSRFLREFESVSESKKLREKLSRNINCEVIPHKNDEIVRKLDAASLRFSEVVR